MFVSLPGIVGQAVGGGCPSPGTILDTLYDQTYPILFGGAYVTIDGTDYPSQKASVNVIADGACGSTTDWANAFDIVYFSDGSDTGLEALDVLNQTEIPAESDYFYNNGTRTGYTWNGSGGYNSSVMKGSYYTAGSDTNLSGLDVVNQVEVPTGSGLYFNSGGSTGYSWDGYGGYVYPTLKGSLFPYGTFIWNDDPNPYYYWDGAGGYYAEYI